LSGYSNLAHWNLFAFARIPLSLLRAASFDIWNFNKLMNIQQGKSPLRIAKAWYFGQRFLLRVYTFGTDLHARKISFCMVDNRYKKGVSALPQPKALWLKQSEIHSIL